MKIKSVIITVIIFAILASIPLLSFKDIKKINNKPVAIIATEQIKEKESSSWHKILRPVLHAGK